MYRLHAGNFAVFFVQIALQLVRFGLQIGDRGLHFRNLTVIAVDLGVVHHHKQEHQRQQYGGKDDRDRKRCFLLFPHGDDFRAADRDEFARTLVALLDLAARSAAAADGALLRLRFEEFRRKPSRAAPF